jgi:RNA polymerase sigma factor (TIGR02999 family)
MPSTGQVTLLLKAWSAGRKEALDDLMPLVYSELRKLAASHMRRERPNHSLQVTGLVNEAYLKLIDQRDANWQDRRHFFGIAAQCMRRILVDHARHRRAQKRGSGDTHVVLDEQLHGAVERSCEVVALDDALQALAELDARQAKIVELRYFGGMTHAEIADALDMSVSTVKRDLDASQIWLTHAMSRPSS